MRKRRMKGNGEGRKEEVEEGFGPPKNFGMEPFMELTYNTVVYTDAENK